MRMSTIWRDITLLLVSNLYVSHCIFRNKRLKQSYSALILPSLQHLVTLLYLPFLYPKEVHTIVNNCAQPPAAQQQPFEGRAGFTKVKELNDTRSDSSTHSLPAPTGHAPSLKNSPGKFEFALRCAERYSSPETPTGGAVGPRCTMFGGRRAGDRKGREGC